MSFNHTLRKPHGYAKITSPDGVEEWDTHTCPHCNAVFHMVPGSGTRRGFCMKCMEVTCGSESCLACIPFEAQLDHMEGKQTKYDGEIFDQFGRKAV